MPVIRPPTNPLTGAPIPPEDLQSSAMDLMGPGFAGHALSTVIGATPAAEGLMNFVRRVWPSLGKAADKIPDIALHYAESPNTPITNVRARGGTYVPPEFAKHLDRPLETPGGEIHLMKAGPQDSESAQQSTQNLIHELLHAIYRHKNAETIANPWLPNLNVEAAQRLMSKELTEPRQGLYGRFGTDLDRLQHGALDAMGKRVYRSKIPSESGLDPLFQ